MTDSLSISSLALAPSLPTTESAPGTPDASTILRQFMEQLQQEQANQHNNTTSTSTSDYMSSTSASTSGSASGSYPTIQPYRFHNPHPHTHTHTHTHPHPHPHPITLPAPQQQQQPILGLDDSVHHQSSASSSHNNHNNNNNSIHLHEMKPLMRDLQFDPHQITTNGEGDDITAAIKPRRKRRKKFSPMDEAEAKALRTKKHSEAEVRRRHKFNELLVDLAKMFNCEKSQKIDILKTIIADVESMRAKIAIYEQRHGPLSTGIGGDGGDGGEDGDEQDTRGPESGSVRSHESECDLDTLNTHIEREHSMTLQPTAGAGRITIQSSLLAMDPSTAQAAATQNMLVAMSQHQRRTQMQTGPSHDSSMQMQMMTPSGSASASTSNSTSNSTSYHHEDPYGIIPHHRQGMSPSVSPVDHRLLFMSSNIAMDVADLSGRIIDCNTHFCELLGYTKSSLLAPSNFFRITHPDSLAHTFAVLSSLLTGGHTAQRSRRKYITRTGIITEVMITCWLTRDQDQQPQYVAEIVEPI